MGQSLREPDSGTEAIAQGGLPGTAAGVLAWVTLQPEQGRQSRSMRPQEPVDCQRRYHSQLPTDWPVGSYFKCKLETKCVIAYVINFNGKTKNHS